MAYKMLPIYSKKSDQLGPFSGNISPLPRTSAPTPGSAGMRNMCISSASITMVRGAIVPSHISLPAMRKVSVPSRAPITTIGCRRISRRRKKSFIVIFFPQRSS